MGKIKTSIKLSSKDLRTNNCKEQKLLQDNSIF